MGQHEGDQRTTTSAGFLGWAARRILSMADARRVPILLSWTVATPKDA